MSKKIRLWTLGKPPDNPITPEIINKLKDIINGNRSGGTIELVWGKVEEIEEIKEKIDDGYPLILITEEQLFPYIIPDYGIIPDKLIPPTYFENENKNSQ